MVGERGDGNYIRFVCWINWWHLQLDLFFCSLSMFYFPSEIYIYMYMFSIMFFKRSQSCTKRYTQKYREREIKMKCQKNVQVTHRKKGKRKQYFQILKITKKSINRWKVKLAVVHPYHGILLINKMTKTIEIQNNFVKSQRHQAEQKRNQSQKVTYCTISFTWRQEKAKL